ncbi:MAG: hypothetical protein KAF27_03240 [Porphyrobacter sp.]|nr:hypothetical protein [Porphyrobacter sp.]
MILNIVFDEEEDFFGWKFRYVTPRKISGWDWCPRKSGIYYFDGDALPNLDLCIMSGYFKFYEKPEIVYPNEIEELRTTKNAFYDSLELLQRNRGWGSDINICLIRDLTNMYGRAVYAYQNQVPQPFDNHEETLYRLSNWYVR